MSQRTLELEPQASIERADSPPMNGQFSNNAVVTGLQSLESLSPNAPAIGWGDTSGAGEFDYIPVTPWAPIALALGLIGLTGFIGVFGLYVAYFGIFIGLAAIAKIRASDGAVKGSWMAVTGLVLSLASASLGSAKMYHAYRTEVPDGYKRVSFQKEVCEKEFVYVNGNRKLDPGVAELMGEKIYIKGFMWATQDSEGLVNFILLKDNGECCFGGRPKSHDFVWVKLAGFNKDESQPELSLRSACMEVTELPDDIKKKHGLTKDYQLTTRSFLGMVAVAGVMQADVKAGKQGPEEDFEYAPVYTMNAELVEEAWTRF